MQMYRKPLRTMIEKFETEPKLTATGKFIIIISITLVFSLSIWQVSLLFFLSQKWSELAFSFYSFIY